MNGSGKLLQATSALLALLLGWQSRAQAADFSKAQKIYVPPSRIERRLDFTSLREREASAGRYSNPGSPTMPSMFSSAAGSSPPSKSGLVPPPPPFTPSLLPSGHAPITVPPPPPAMPLLADSHSTPSPATKPAATGGAPKPSAQETSYLAGARARAQELIKQGKLEEADSLLRSLYKASPKDTLVKNDLVNLSLERTRKFLASKDSESALKSAREAAYVDPANSKAQALLDQAIRESGINPADAIERLKMADLLASQGRSTAATVEYRAALKLKPSAAAHIGLGNIALRNGQKTLAKSEFQQALETDPNSAPAYHHMGLLRLSSGDTVGANTDLSRAVILDPQDKISGKALVELWQRQVSKSPADANARLGLARAYQLTGDLKSAQAEYKQVVRIDPDHPNLAAARQSFKLALAKQEADRDLQAAHMLESQGALAAAAEKVLAGLALNPSDVGARLYLGQLSEKMGQFPQARCAYMEVLKDDPNNLTAAQRLKVLPAASSPAMAPAVPQAGMIGPGEAKPLPTMPPATIDQVTTLSNFIVPLRNHIMAEKNRIEEVENNARKALGSINHNVLGTPGLSTAAGQPLTPASETLSAPSSLAGSGAVSALTAAALSSIAGGAPLASGAPMLSLPPAGGFDSGPAHLLGNATPAIASAGGPVDVGTLQRMQALEQQNRDLKQQLQQVQRALQTLQVPGASPQSLVAPQGGALARSPATSWPPALAASPPPMVAPQSIAPQAAPVPAPPLAVSAAPMQAANAAGAPVPSLAQGLTPPEVQLQLAGMKPSLKDIRLQVVLKNNTDAVLALPSKPTAIFRCATAPDTPVKVSFPLKAVPAHSELHGTIKIPRHQLDPSTDLFMPDLLPASAGDRNVHLTAPGSVIN